MSTVQEIQEAIQGLSEPDRRKLLDWIETEEERTWDEQIARDFDSGKLDKLIQSAKDEASKGTLRSSP